MARFIPCTLLLIATNIAVVWSFQARPVLQAPTSTRIANNGGLAQELAGLRVAPRFTVSVADAIATESVPNQRARRLPTLVPPIVDTAADLQQQFSRVVSRGWNSVLGTSIQLSQIQWDVIVARLIQAAKLYWWAVPLTLCLVPPLSVALLQQPALSPHWWKMVRMDNMRQSADAVLVVSCFLLSNIAYFWSGALLLSRLPPRSSRVDFKTSTNGGGRLQLLTSVLPKTVPLPCRYSGLGFWVLAAGLMSTVFHSVQALGDPILAEAFCYLDHGIAISSTLYFFHVCGPPKNAALVLGSMGTVALALPLPAQTYAWLHSVWHFLSAAASVAWALQQQGKAQRRDVLLQAIRTTRKIKTNNKAAGSVAQ